MCVGLSVTTSYTRVPCQPTQHVTSPGQDPNSSPYPNPAPMPSTHVQAGFVIHDKVEVSATILPRYIQRPAVRVSKAAMSLGSSEASLLDSPKVASDSISIR